MVNDITRDRKKDFPVGKSFLKFDTKSVTRVGQQCNVTSTFNCNC